MSSVRLINVTKGSNPGLYAAQEISKIIYDSQSFKRFENKNPWLASMLCCVCFPVYYYLHGQEISKEEEQALNDLKDQLSTLNIDSELITLNFFANRAIVKNAAQEAVVLINNYLSLYSTFDITRDAVRNIMCEISEAHQVSVSLTHPPINESATFSIKISK